MSKAPAERWLPVPGFEGHYAVSDRGRVLSLERRCDCGGKTRRVRQRLLKVTWQKKRGRVCAGIVKLSRPDEAGEYFTVARLVLLVFVGPPLPGQVAHYKDGDCTNGALSNLEWSNYAVVSRQSYRPRSSCVSPE